ncbi:vacuolar import and degradation protein-domain-containing protein [Kickxella alabastrina]|uniref:vacuolar import and degradation protein-domain-containing protein n=1 Tax=Kickxella alabastrina TaxID=61397 RepID=UPI002220E74C|nr:vacuolar import and degradation protein-domain-containing protein [Kickxella alabastrina]KAI7827761.1 vacuolar import and degradation protein-domain-containing protein [Kickxella alabastrina]
MNNTIQREQHQHQETSQREENPDLSIASFREEHHLRRIHARSEQQLMRWLMKSTVDTRALDCALLRPGMEFCGVQRITPWKANGREDTDHWSLFEPVKQVPQTFLQKWPESMRGKRMPRILEDYLFMRWKESTFINVGPSETGLTIEGFYYICMDRITGAIEGAYFDPSTQPNQRLTLSVKNDGKCLAFASSEFC